MRKHLVLVAAWSLLGCAGCALWSGPRVKPEPVTFSHPEEVIRGEGFIALADRRQFAVMAFLNATGFDEEVQGQQMHLLRVKVREMVAANLAEHPRKVKAWRKYRNGLIRKYAESFAYQDYALSLSGDYPFRKIRPDSELGYRHENWILGGLTEVLNDFWKTARLDEIWDAVKDEYIAELKRYDLQGMQREMAALWEYLGMERPDSFTLVHVPNPLDCHFSAIGAHYEDYYYCVEGPGGTSHGLNAHEYLHSIVNSLVRENCRGHKSKLLKYYRAGKRGLASEEYQTPTAFVSECLIHAIDHRLAARNDPRRENWANQRVAALAQDGLMLTEPFYRLLPEYEQSGVPFDRYLPTLLDHLPEYQPRANHQEVES